MSCGDFKVDASQSRIHTLSAGLLAWQDGEDPVFSHFIICNNTNHAVKFGQVMCATLKRCKHFCCFKIVNMFFSLIYSGLQDAKNTQ